MEIIRPLLRNMRDVRRYTASVAGTVRDLDGQVALTDVLALEVVRIFLPDVFRLLSGSVDGLTTTFDSGDEEDLGSLKKQVEVLITAADAHAPA